MDGTEPGTVGPVWHSLVMMGRVRLTLKLPQNGHGYAAFSAFRRVARSLCRPLDGVRVVYYLLKGDRADLVVEGPTDDDEALGRGIDRLCSELGIHSRDPAPARPTRRSSSRFTPRR